MAEKKSTMSLLSLPFLSVVDEASPLAVVDWLGCDDDAAELGVSVAATKSGVDLNPVH